MEVYSKYDCTLLAGATSVEITCGRGVKKMCHLVKIFDKVLGLKSSLGISCVELGF